MNNIKLPNFLLVGTAKAATTSLYNYLKQHPDIFFCLPKEPLFFVFGDKKNINKEINSVNTWEDYQKLFFRAGSFKAVGEASTLYLYKYRQSIKNILKYLPTKENTKIIISLRQPAERAFSHFAMRQRNGLEKMSFMEAIKQERERRNEKYYFGYVDMGFYYKQVKAFLDNFLNVKIVLFEDIVNSPVKTVQDIYQFLGVDVSFVPVTHRAYNISGKPKSKFINHLLFGDYKTKKFLEKIFPTGLRKELVRIIAKHNLTKITLSQQERNYLNNIYTEDIDKLAKLINRDLSKWRDTN